jgi:hypothetical protein
MLGFQGAACGKHDAVGEIHKTNGVWSEDAHAACGFDELLLPSCALLANFAVAAGEHDCGARADRRKLAYRLMGALCAKQYDRYIRDGGQRADIRIACERSDAAHFRIEPDK